MDAASASSARVDFRTTRETKLLIERAAALLGMTVSEYAKASLVARSNEVIRHHTTRTLSDRDRDAFLELLDAETAPSAELSAAARSFHASEAAGEIVP